MSNHAPPIARCPQCSKEMLWDTTNRYRPFCSERCKLVDLGKWANEDYRIEQRDVDFMKDNSDSPN